MNSPILFLVFNRLDPTEKVFSAIRRAKPKKLYIASDGPRKSELQEGDKVNEIRTYVVNKVDWDCEVNTLFRDSNLGCKVAVSQAIDWFFSIRKVLFQACGHGLKS